MRVGIIGAGSMGSAFARRLSAAGHEVVVTSRDIADARKVATSVSSKVRAVPQQQLAENVDVAGPLSNARYLEPLGMLNIYLGYVGKMGTDVAPAVRKVASEVEARADQTARETARAAAATGRSQAPRPSAG
jgi:predicted dinucleotide-binding enzyme